MKLPKAGFCIVHHFSRKVNSLLHGSPEIRVKTSFAVTCEWTLSRTIEKESGVDSWPKSDIICDTHEDAFGETGEEMS